MLHVPIHTDTGLFPSPSFAGLLFFFQNTCKGYTFLCKHNFYFSAGGKKRTSKSPRSNSSWSLKTSDVHARSTRVRTKPRLGAAVNGAL